MTILKQNGTSAKILRANQSGKAMKQNYNFGNSFIQLSNIHFDVPSLVGSDFSGDISFIQWLKTYSDPTITCGSLLIKKDNNNNLTFGFGFKELGTGISKLIDGVYTDVSYNASSNPPFLWKKDNTNMSHGDLMETKKISIATGAMPNLTSIEGLILGRGRMRSSSSDTYLRSKRSYDLLFKRIISDSERVYIYNNLLGNEPLNRLGLELYIKYDNAELFDFGGVIGQAVGVRDYSGNNNHARIINLPAGTLQEKLDYANNNLFQPW